ncbi:hypothetical protein AX16_007898 [Volvariella volvacea WC 439]|nr:hypothetical protein AX16_007898 [Volvariella volvacea WC 439]
MDRLAPELLQIICTLLDDRDLCTAASSLSCRSLHAACLDELFFRNQTFIPTPASLPSRAPERSYTVVRPTPGDCISLNAHNTSFVLRGLNLALPYYFHGRSITALVGALHRPSSLGQDLKCLSRFLVTHPQAESIESIVLDFGPARLPDEEFGQLLGFLRIFSGDGESKMARCISLTLSGGGADPQHSHGINTSGSPSPRQSGTIPTTVQAFITLAVGAVGLRRNLKPSPIGLVSVNLDTELISHLSTGHTHWAIDLFALNSISLRSVSISRWCALWGNILAHTTLPNLEELRLNGNLVEIPLLVTFLARHRNLKVFEAGSPVEKFELSSPTPAFFLPNLTSLVTCPQLFVFFLTPRLVLKPLPSLKKVTLVLYFSGFRPFLQYLLWNDTILNLGGHIDRRLGTLSLGLRICVQSAKTNWVKDKYEGNERPDQSVVCNQLKFIQFHLEYNPNFLENGDIRSRFAKWLRLFPAVESVEMRGCCPMNGENSEGRKELAHRVQAMNSSLRNFCVDGVELL